MDWVTCLRILQGATAAVVLGWIAYGLWWLKALATVNF